MTPLPFLVVPESASSGLVGPTLLRMIEIPLDHQANPPSISRWSDPTDNLSPCSHLSTNPPPSRPSAHS